MTQHKFLSLDASSQPSPYMSLLSPPLFRLNGHRHETRAVSVSHPPFLQFIRLLLLPILRPLNKTVLLFLPAIFRFPILPLLLQFCSGW